MSFYNGDMDISLRDLNGLDLNWEAIISASRRSEANNVQGGDDGLDSDATTIEPVEGGAAALPHNAPHKEKALDDDTIRNFSIAKLFSPNKGRVNGVGFSGDGSHVVTSATDDQINLFDPLRGSHLRTCHSKKYGCDLVTFTHTVSNVLYASTKLSHELRYLSLHDNKFIRYFSGHTDKVTNLHMSPVNDFFLTTSLDKTIRLWDLRSPNAEGVLHLMTPGVGAFDPEGLVFAVGMSSDTVKMYDIRAFEKGPFCTFHLPSMDPNHPQNRGFGAGHRFQGQGQCHSSSMAFNPNGMQILINTNGPYIYILESFMGEPKFCLERSLCGKDGSGGQGKLEACFTPDGKYIMSTNGNGTIVVWGAGDGGLVTILNPHLPPQRSAVASFRFNPRLAMLVSADVLTAFWLQRGINHVGSAEADDDYDASSRGSTNTSDYYSERPMST